MLVFNPVFSDIKHVHNTSFVVHDMLEACGLWSLYVGRYTS